MFMQYADPCQMNWIPFCYAPFNILMFALLAISKLHPQVNTRLGTMTTILRRISQGAVSHLHLVASIYWCNYEFATTSFKWFVKGGWCTCLCMCIMGLVTSATSAVSCYCTFTKGTGISDMQPLSWTGNDEQHTAGKGWDNYTIQWKCVLYIAILECCYDTTVPRTFTSINCFTIHLPSIIIYHLTSSTIYIIYHLQFKTLLINSCTV